MFSDEHRLNSARLCLIILTCIAEVIEFGCSLFVFFVCVCVPYFDGFYLLSVKQDQYADAFLHDDNINFRVSLHRMVRGSAPVS